MKKKLPPLSDRLKEALKYIEKGDICADIGTDHAYLPIHIILSGLSEKAYASDINEGPCEIARRNISRYGLTGDDIIVSRRDGIEGLTDTDITKFIICGMGGELIASVLDAEKPRIGTRFILNPMTHPERLRRYLREHGFSVIDESFVLSGSKYYQLIYCEYTERMTRDIALEIDLRFGRINLERRDGIILDYMRRTLGELKRARDERQKAGLSSPDDRLIAEMEFYLGFDAEAR